MFDNDVISSHIRLKSWRDFATSALLKSTVEKEKKNGRFFMVFNGIKAWSELMKLGLSVGNLRKDIDAFFKENIIGEFEKVGLFSFLITPHSKEDIAEFLQASDDILLDQVLDTFCSDKVLKKSHGNYKLNTIIDGVAVSPRIFEDTLIDLFKNYAAALPARLQGKFVQFSSGINLYNWDDALTSKMYTQVRSAAFAFADVTRKPVKFLDVGCGNGYNTTAIWNAYFQNNLFKDSNGMRIFGIDPDRGLINIAQNEFAKRASKLTGQSREEIQKFEEYFPRFQVGDMMQIPYEDGFFDVVYASQVLHWADPKKALKEMMRVTRAGGKIFGTENFYPEANKYNDLHFKVVEGAYGLFWKKDLIQWAKDCGAQEVKIVTPISIFLIKKGPANKPSTTLPTIEKEYYPDLSPLDVENLAVGV